MSYAGCGSFDNTGSPLSCPLPRPELEGDEHGGDPIGYDAASGEAAETARASADRDAGQLCLRINETIWLLI